MYLVPYRHANDESRDHNDRLSCGDHPKYGKRKTDRGNASEDVDYASAHVIGQTSEQQYRNQLHRGAQSYGSKHETTRQSQICHGVAQAESG